MTVGGRAIYGVLAVLVLAVVAVLMHSFYYGLEVLGLFWPSGSRYVQPMHPWWMPDLYGWAPPLIGIGFWLAVGGVYLRYRLGLRWPILELFSLVYLAVLGAFVAWVTLAGLGAHVGLIEPPPPWEEEARRWWHPGDAWSDD